MRFFNLSKHRLPATSRNFSFPFFPYHSIYDRRTEHFLFEVGLYHMPTNMAYGFETQSTRLSTAISRRPGGRLTNGRLPLFHFHHQRRRRGFWSSRVSHELHRTEASLQNVATKPAMSALRRSLRGQTHSAYPGENAPQYFMDLGRPGFGFPFALTQCLNSA